MNITIEVIEHHAQRYDTCGDWQYNKDKTELKIKVSDLGDWRYNALVGLHEAIEALSCEQHGITEKMVDDFDIIFEKNRSVDDPAEPGDAFDAPYRHQHFFATSIERLIAQELDVSWSTYEAEIDKLVY